MPELEHDLATLATELEWPETPDLAAAAVARVRGTAPRRRRLRRPRLAIAIAALILAVPAAALAFPGVREWLGLRHVTVRTAPQQPRAQAHEFGARLPLATTARRARLTPLVPPALRGAAAYERRGALTLRGHGLLLEQRRGSLYKPYLEKIVRVASDVRRVEIHGRPGLWFRTQHEYTWRTPPGGYVEQLPTRSAPALVWEQGGLILRLEGAHLTRARAIAIAEAAR